MYVSAVVAEVARNSYIAHTTAVRAGCQYTTKNNAALLFLLKESQWLFDEIFSSLLKIEEEK